MVLPAAPGTANGELAGTRLVAEAVALARLLPELRESGRAGALAVETRDGRELARLRADAQVMEQVAGTGAVTAAQRRAADDVRTALTAVPPGALPEATAGHAVAAAGAVARLRVFAEALCGPDHAAAFAAHSSRPADPLDEDAWSWARNAAVVRAAIGTLERRRAELDPAVAVFAARLAAGEEGPADAWLRDRLARIAAGRVRRAEELTRRLRAKMRPPGPCAIPAVDPARLPWLRQVLKYPLYTPEFEARVAPWLATDPFGLRVPPPAPEFLSGIDVTAVPAEQVAPLLRRISLTRPAPAAGELTPDALAARPDSVSVALRPPETRAWGQAPGSGAPLLPERTEIPRLVHGIWLGRPMPATSSFWDNYARGARRYAERADFVLWTDVPRARFDAARATPAPDGAPDPYAYERKLLDWATDNDIVLVNFLELFHAGAPMRTYPLYVLEMAKQLPRGYAAASDHLRVEIVHRFGGAYVDGDDSFVPAAGATADLPRFLDQVAASAFGFTLNPKPGLGVANDIIVGPARHPVFDVWLECARLNYFRTTADIFGGKPAMAGKFVGERRQAHRYVTAHRTGRVHHRVLGVLGIESSALPQTDTVVATASELSWVPPRTGEPAGRGDEGDEEVLRTLAGCVTFLQWQLIARTGDLYLAAVEPVLRRLPDPDAAWTAVLSTLAALSGLDGTPAVASVTDLRRGDDHRLSTVDLPPEAEALLDRSARPAAWLGAGLGAAGEPVWLLDERVAPAACRGPADAVAHPLARFAEVAVDPLGTPVGLRLCVKGTVADRFGGRFAGLAPDELGVRIVVDSGDGRLSVPAASVAGLLAELGAAHRPVVVLAGGWAPAEPFTARLGALLGSPVRHRASEDTTSAEPLVEYLPFAAYLRRRDSAGRYSAVRY